MYRSRAGAVGFDGLLERLLSPSGDVDFGAIRDKSLRYHQSNTSASTGNDSCHVGDIKELRAVQVAGIGFVRSHCSRDVESGARKKVALQSIYFEKTG